MTRPTSASTLTAHPIPVADARGIGLTAGYGPQLRCQPPASGAAFWGIAAVPRGQNANRSLLEAHFPAGQFERLATMNDGPEIVISAAPRPRAVGAPQPDRAGARPPG